MATRERTCKRHLDPRGLVTGLVMGCLLVAGCSSSTDLNGRPVTASSSSAPAPGALLTPKPVKAAAFPIEESGPAARHGWFTWERANFKKHTDNYWAQHNGGPRLRINPKGTFGRDGDISAGRVVYSRERIHPYRATQTDIWQYNLATGHQFRLTRRVNTPRGFELEPSLSGPFLLFRRELRPSLYATETDKVMLFDRARQVMKTLAVVRREARNDLAPFVDPGQVNGRYATWTRVAWFAKPLKGGAYYDAPRSRVVLYDVKSGVTTRYAVMASNYVWSSAVSSDGTLYYVRSAVTASAYESETPDYFMKRPLGGAPVVIAKLPPHVAIHQLYVEDRPDGSHRLYFTIDNGNGRAGHNDVYKITDPPPSSE